MLLESFPVRKWCCKGQCLARQLFNFSSYNLNGQSSSTPNSNVTYPQFPLWWRSTVPLLTMPSRRYMWCLLAANDVVVINLVNPCWVGRQVCLYKLAQRNEVSRSFHCCFATYAKRCCKHNNVLDRQSRQHTTLLRQKKYFVTITNRSVVTRRVTIPPGDFSASGQ